eukprot:173884_1
MFIKISHTMFHRYGIKYGPAHARFYVNIDNFRLFSSHNQNIQNEFARQSDSLFNFNKINHDKLSQPLINHTINIEKRLNKSCKVLEVGCGPGLIAVECAKQLKMPQQIIGIDITKEMIDIANNYCLTNGIDSNLLQFMQCNAEDLPFNDNEFDIIVTRWTLHHCNELNKCLKEMFRVLNKNGGTLIFNEITAPTNKIELYNAIAKLRDPTHIWGYDEIGWINELRNVGFQHDKINVREKYFGVERCVMDWIQQTKTIERESLYVLCEELYNNGIEFGYNLQMNENGRLTMQHSYIIVEAQCS